MEPILAQAHTAATAADPSRWDNLVLAAEHLTGLVIVIIALISLWGLTVLIGRIVMAFEKRAAAAAPVPAPVAAVAASAGVGPPDDDIVVVAAAVAAMLDGPHRVVSVRPQSSGWGQQGRRDIHASRRIR